MAIEGPHFPVDEASLMYQARTALATLGDQIAAIRDLTKPIVIAKIKQAAKIRYWLKALDYKDFLTRQQREQIWYSLIEISGIYNFPTAPVLGLRTRPAILVGIQGPQGETGPAGPSGGTAFTSTSINGTTTSDSFAFSLGSAAIWEYTITDGTNQRSGTIEATWLSSGASIDCGAEITGTELGSTSTVTLSADINSGSVRLRATAASTAWTIKGTRLIIP